MCALLCALLCSIVCRLSLPFQIRSRADSRLSCARRHCAAGPSIYRWFSLVVCPPPPTRRVPLSLYIYVPSVIASLLLHLATEHHVSSPVRCARLCVWVYGCMYVCSIETSCQNYFHFFSLSFVSLLSINVTVWMYVRKIYMYKNLFYLFSFSLLGWIINSKNFGPEMRRSAQI